MKTKNYKCPNCKKLVATRVPTKDLVLPEKGYWDSGVRCPYCEFLFYKKVWPDGKIEVFSI